MEKEERDFYDDQNRGNDKLQQVAEPVYYEEDEGVVFSEYSWVLKLFIVSLGINCIRLIIEAFSFIDKPIGLSFVVPVDIIFSAFIIYVIVAFVRHAPNAVFLGKAFLIIELLLLILIMFSGESGENIYIRGAGRIFWLTVWFLYFHFSEEAFPKEYRKTYKRDYYIVTFVVVLPILLLVMNVFGNTYNFIKFADEYRIEQSSLLEREHTDGLIAFTNPDECLCEKFEAENGVEFHYLYNENIECTIGGDVYYDLSDALFLKYRDNWVSENFTMYAKDEAPVERHTTYNGNVYWVATTTYYDLDFVVIWDFIIILDEETQKSCVLSCYYLKDAEGLKNQILNSVRFK